MENNTLYYVYGMNRTVTEYYVQVILSAFHYKGYESHEVTIKEAGNLDRNSLVLVLDSENFVKLYIRGFRKLIVWIQGAWPEESYMRNHSRLRFWLQSKMEKFTLRHTKLCFLVSREQLRHYQRKYQINIEEKVYIMPCYNCEIDKKSFYYEGKYENDVFCYAGGTAVWQCFRETLELYKKIEDKKPDVTLRLFTKDKELAEKYIKEIGIRNYAISFVKPSELPLYLAQCKYGFIIRQEDVVNNVATPTKLSTYLSCGLIPIMTDAVKDFVELFSDRQYAVISNKSLDREVLKFTDRKIAANDVYSEYKEIFDTYYNNDYHRTNIVRLLNKTI